MAYSGIKTKKNKNGTDNIYVTFKYLNTRYAEKNFTKLFGCNTEAKAFQKLQWIKLEISEGRDPFVVVKETLNDLYDEWLEINLSNGEWRERTAETYNFFYNKYIRDKVGKKNIAKIKVSELQDIYDKDMKDIKAYSRVQMKKILNPLFRRAIMKGLIKKNIISEMIFIKNVKKEREKVSERLNESFLDVVRKLYNAIPHFSGYRKETKEEVRMFLMMCLLTAHRHGEIAQIEAKDCYLEDGYIIARNHITKTDENYKFPIPAELIPYIQSIESGLIFPTLKTGSIGDYFQRLLKLAKIKIQEGKRVSPHDIRRWQKMIMIKYCKIDSALSEVCLSHKKQGVGAHYEDFTYEDVEEAYQIYWDLIREPIEFVIDEHKVRKPRKKKEYYEELKKAGWEAYVPVAERIDPKNPHYRKPMA